MLKNYLEGLKEEKYETEFEKASIKLLNLHYVDISWDTVLSILDAVLEVKCAPVYSIELQILQAALQAY